MIVILVIERLSEDTSSLIVVIVSGKRGEGRLSFDFVMLHFFRFFLKRKSFLG